MLTLTDSLVPASQYFAATGALNWYTTPSVAAVNYYYWMGLESDGRVYRWPDGNNAGTGATSNDNPYAHFTYQYQVSGMGCQSLQPLLLMPAAIPALHSAACQISRQHAMCQVYVHVGVKLAQPTSNMQPEQAANFSLVTQLTPLLLTLCRTW